MDVDVESGVVLADRWVSDEQGEFDRTFLTLDLVTALPDALFSWPRESPDPDKI